MPTIYRPVTYRHAIYLTQVRRNGTFGYNNTPFWSVIGFNRHRTTSDNIPDWRARIRAGLDATTYLAADDFVPLNKVAANVYCERTVWDGKWYATAVKSIAINGYLSFPPLPVLSDTLVSEATDQARRKTVSNINKLRTKFESGKFLVEVGDTIRMLKQPLKGLRDGLSKSHTSAKKLKQRFGSSMTKKQLSVALSELWLEYQFGWKPLSNDIDSALTNLRELSLPKHVRFRASGRVSQRDKVGGDYNETQQADVGIIVNTFATNTATATFRGMLKVPPPNGWTWSSWGLSTRDFLPSVWEWIPWSFAVDYFTNIGDIISSYSIIPSEIAWMNRTIRREIRTVKYGVKLSTSTFFATFPGGKQITQIGSLGQVGHAVSSVERMSVTPDALIPRLSFRVPAAGSLKWLNLAALAHLKTL